MSVTSSVPMIFLYLDSEKVIDRLISIFCRSIEGYQKLQETGSTPRGYTEYVYGYDVWIRILIPNLSRIWANASTCGITAGFRPVEPPTNSTLPAALSSPEIQVVICYPFVLRGRKKLLILTRQRRWHKCLR